jgi:flagellar hook-basal body complex protein FliE
MVTPLVAARAYAAVQNGARPPGAAAPVADGADFGQMVTKAVQDVVGNSKAAETQMSKAMTGKADLVDVVTSISAAQTSLETMMAVRDQVISAYQSILNMPI